MPPGDNSPPAAGHELELWQAALRGLLEDTTVQVMRQAARQWGWSLKGTAKSDLIEQMVDYLGDAPRMAAAIQTIPAEELAVLSWLAALATVSSSSKQLRAALAEGSGLRMSQKAVDAYLQSLIGRCLVFYSEYLGYRLPDLYRLWLPRPAASKLLAATVDRLHQPPALTVAGITQHAQRLLGALILEQPPAVVAPKQTPRYGSARTDPLDPCRPSLVAGETLVRWGYVTPSEQHLARFLLEQMANARLFMLRPQQDRAVLAAAEPPNPAWELATAAERLLRLRRAYLALPKEGESRFNSWSEWDMLFAQGQGDSLQPAGYWVTADLVLQQTQVLGVWFSGLIAGLPADTWFGVEPFCKLIYQVQRDFMISSSSMSRWTWVVNGESLDAQQLPFERWMKSYGRLVEVWLTGPASWLLFVQVAYADGRPAAFRRPSALPAGVAEQAPAGSLRFMADDTIALANDWRASDLRRLLRSISVEVARDAATTLLRLDAGAFRETLRAGQDAAAIGAAFKDAGFPLSPPVRETLRLWQGRAGRYQLYDQMAVVEFGEDVLPEELHAISRLSNAEFYQPAPRCLIFPDSQVAPALVEELRRRGYTPQVLS